MSMTCICTSWSSGGYGDAPADCLFSWKLCYKSGIMEVMRNLIYVYWHFIVWWINTNFTWHCGNSISITSLLFHVALNMIRPHKCLFAVWTLVQGSFMDLCSVFLQGDHVWASHIAMAAFYTDGSLWMFLNNMTQQTFLKFKLFVTLLARKQWGLKDNK